MMINIIVFLLSILFSITAIEIYTPITIQFSIEYVFVLTYTLSLVYLIVRYAFKSIFYSENNKHKLIIFILTIILAAIFPMPSQSTEKAVYIKMEVLEKKNDNSLGNEVWISDIYVDNNKINFDEVEHNEKWIVKHGMLLSNGAKPAHLQLEIKGNQKVKITFVSHRWSGKVKLSINDKEYVKDLYDYNGKTETINYEIGSEKNIYNHFKSFIINYVLVVTLFALVLYLGRINTDKSIYVTFDESNILKGIAIIMVIISHLRLTQVISLPNQLNYLGDWGVVIFLLLSGYGLARSYVLKGINNNFLIRRLKKVILPYSIVTLIWIIVDFLIHKKIYSVRVILTSIIGLDFTRSIDPTMWFVTFIILWYLIFYATFSLKIKNRYKYIILLFFSIFFGCCDSIQFMHKMHIQWKFHAYVFPIGVIAGIKIEEKNLILNKINNKILIAIKYFIPAVLFGKYINNISSPEIYFIVNLSVGLIIIFFIKDLSKQLSQSLILNKIGQISFELYLVHFGFMTKLNVFKLGINNKLSILIYFLVIFIVAIFLKNVVEKLRTFREEGV